MQCYWGHRHFVQFDALSIDDNGAPILIEKLKEKKEDTMMYMISSFHFQMRLRISTTGLVGLVSQKMVIPL